MVRALGVPLDVGPVEIHLAEIAFRVALGLIVEVRRLRIAVEPARGDRPRPHAIAEFDDGDEAVAGVAVHLLRVRIGARAEGGERSPARRGEAYRDAGLAVVVRGSDVVGEPLEAVDLSPRHLPGA